MWPTHSGRIRSIVWEQVHWTWGATLARLETHDDAPICGAGAVRAARRTMADETKSHATAPVLDDALHAPVVFFDSVPAFGLIKGIVAMTLSTGRWLEIDDAVQIRPVVVGHLRMTLEGAAALRDALDKSLLAATQIKGNPN